MPPASSGTCLGGAQRTQWEEVRGKGQECRQGHLRPGLPSLVHTNEDPPTPPLFLELIVFLFQLFGMLLYAFNSEMVFYLFLEPLSLPG